MVVGEPLPPPLRWHLPSDSNPEIAACDIPMPVQPIGAKLPFCAPCLKTVLTAILSAPRKPSAREEFGDPRLNLKRKKE